MYLSLEKPPGAVSETSARYEASANTPTGEWEEEDIKGKNEEKGREGYEILPPHVTQGHKRTTTLFTRDNSITRQPEVRQRTCLKNTVLRPALRLWSSTSIADGCICQLLKSS